MSTEGNVAIVTGAAQGIGRAIATCLLSQGYKVYIFDILTSKGNETAKELQQRYGQTKATFIQCDVADKNQFTDSFNKVVKECGHVSLMVNNAGTVDEYDFEQCIAVNLSGVIRGSNLAISHMRKDQGGQGGMIINTASIVAFDSFHHFPTYCATKSGIINFTRSWANNPKCEEYGLTFMCLCPGYVDTELTRHGGSKTLDKAYFEETKVIYEAIGLDTIKEAFLKLITDKQNGSIIEAASSVPEYVRNPALGGLQSNHKTT